MTKVGALHRVEDVPAPAVRFFAVRRVAEGQEQTAAIRLKPVQGETSLAGRQRYVYPSDAPKGERAPGPLPLPAGTLPAQRRGPRRRVHHSGGDGCGEA